MMEERVAQRNRSIKPNKTRQSLSITHPNAADIDIGSASHFVAVPPDRDVVTQSSFGAICGSGPIT